MKLLVGGARGSRIGQVKLIDMIRMLLTTNHLLALRYMCMCVFICLYVIETKETQRSPPLSDVCVCARSRVRGINR